MTGNGRLERDLLDLSEFGRTDAGGVTRLAWSSDLAAATEWLLRRMGAAALHAEVDAAGNVVGCWPSGSGSAVVIGSHIDTVPNGGRFDGALGVLAGIEAVEILREAGVSPARPVWVVAFMDEEGVRFGEGFFGSRAFVGETLETRAEMTDSDGTTLREAMATLGKPFGEVRDSQRVSEVGEYLELHIEQGPVLENAGVDIGIVTDIVGLMCAEVELRGQAGHAGTTPMSIRRDALVGAARVQLALGELAIADGAMTATVGEIAVRPGAANVIPGSCRFSVDVRLADPTSFARIAGEVGELIESIADEQGLELELVEPELVAPTRMDATLVDVLERAAEAEGATRVRMSSGAGHDAMILARHVPAGMIFVPNRGGLSHTPDEYAEPRACALGARVLARAVAELVL